MMPIVKVHLKNKLEEKFDELHRKEMEKEGREEEENNKIHYTNEQINAKVAKGMVIGEVKKKGKGCNSD